MDPIANPFSPGAGAPPPELVGREAVLEEARILLGRVRFRRSAQSIILTGLRGVGKTVLLNEIKRMSYRADVLPIKVEASEDKSLGSLLAAPLKKVLFELDRMEGAKDKVKKGLVALRNFIGTIKIGIGDLELGIDPQAGFADSGDLEFDLAELFSCVAEAAADKGRGVILLLDEIQYLPEKELGALVMAMHRLQQLALPMAMIGAGLPTLPGLTGNAKSYAERLFVFPEIGALSKENSIRAIRVPLAGANVRINDDAAEFVFQRSGGYPYFIQEWGFQLWNFVQEEPITLADAKCVDVAVADKLDRSFFRVRMERLTQAERAMLFALAEMEGPTYKLQEVADHLKMNVRALSPRRSSLIAKGMIYSPGTGLVAFTVPLFAEYLKRTGKFDAG